MYLVLFYVCNHPEGERISSNRELYCTNSIACLGSSNSATAIVPRDIVEKRCPIHMTRKRKPPAKLKATNQPLNPRTVEGKRVRDVRRSRNVKRASTAAVDAHRSGTNGTKAAVQKHGHMTRKRKAPLQEAPAWSTVIPDSQPSDLDEENIVQNAGSQMASANRQENSSQRPLKRKPSAKPKKKETAPVLGCRGNREQVGSDSASGSKDIHPSSEGNTAASIQEAYLCTLNSENRSIIEKGLNDLDYLSDFIRRTCSGKIDNFKDRLIACSRKMRQSAAVQRLVDVNTVISASDASDEIFASADEAIKIPLMEHYKLQKGYLQNQEYVDSKGIPEVVKITKEICLDDELQEFSMALIALLASEYENGVEGLYDALERAIEQKVGSEQKTLEDIRQSFTQCMEDFLQPHIGPGWRIRHFEENEVIPSKYEHIFPESIHLYEFVKEGLKMSTERLLGVLVFPEAIKFSRQLNATGTYASHVLLPRQYTTDGGVQWRYTLHQDFFFGSVPIGDDSHVFVSTEGRCINSQGDSLGIPVTGQLRPKFFIAAKSKKKKVRKLFKIHQVVGMAKYGWTPSQFLKKCGPGMSTDHLTIQASYNQPSLLRIADAKQQANNKRPRSRETFRGQSLEVCYTQFKHLSNERKAIAQRCKDSFGETGLPMVRLEKDGDNWKLDDPNLSEKWVDVVRCTNVLFFEEEQCIWRKYGDGWYFLADVMDIIQRNRYRGMRIAGESIYISCAIAFTKLCAAVLGKRELSKKFLHKFQLEDIARRTDEDGVQIKTVWRRDDGAIEKLNVDHINGQTGLNRSDNLRVVTNGENTALSRGKRRRAIISNNGKEETVTGESTRELGGKIVNTMREMEFPKEQIPSPETVRRVWITKRRIPKRLQDKIVIQDVDDQKDNADEDRFFPTNVIWFLGTFEDKGTGEIHEQAYWGNERMLVGIKKTLGLSELDDSSRFVDVAHMYDKKKRREVIRKEFSHIGEGSRYVLRDLYSSRTWTRGVNSKVREEKRQALRERRRLHQNDVDFSETPQQTEAERNAEYDLNDGNGPRKFGLGKWLIYEIEQYKHGKRTNEEMEELMDDMGLSAEGRTEFKRRCGWTE
ncbi:hypothetical protein PSENEW3_00002397 [Picochlorum sp. SENEW3]|nr:hypothetical protein PSENEW3_00002397 [Picochlorum sp. SENEW3]